MYTILFVRFNRKSKQTERQVLEQGITLPKPSMTAPCPLPAPLTRPTELVSGTSERHQFVLPTNAAGTANTVRRQRAVLLKPPVAVLSSYSLSAAQFPPGAVFISTPPVDTVPAAEPELPRSTMAYRRKRIQAELQGSVRRQRYNRKEGTICRQCGQQRLAESHRQYYGNWWCRETSHVTFEEWVDRLKEQGKGKRQKTDESQ